MKKRLIGTLLFGALVVSSSSVFVSCTDYDDDIKSLQEQIDANRKSLGALSDQITAGSLITNVQKNGKDVIITLNNGQTYTVEGGADGKDGVNGINGTNGVDGKDAVVWTIGDDGFWYKDGVKTDYKALGVDGQNGQNGADAIAPTVRINSSTGEWEISYDNGTTWQSTGVKAQGEKGDKGDKGDTGATGAKGDKGDKGDTGATGAKGDKGDKGDTGATGAKGDKGDKGDTGDKGDKGDKGDTGAAGVTPMLKILDNGNWAVSIDGGVTWTDLGVKAQGEKGEKGDTGAQGEKGEKGDTGAQGEKGDKGDTGATGAQGEKGDKGDTGAKGDKGDTGNYYMPAEDGFFHLYDATGKDLGIAKDADGNDLQWRNQVGLTAVFNAETGKLELYGIADEDGNIDYTKAVTLWNNDVQSLVFEKDQAGRAYVDGVPAIRVQRFEYQPKKWDKYSTKDEKLVNDGGKKVINPETYAYYHVNPSTASFEQIKENLKFVVKKDADYIVTRAAASADFNVEAEALELKDGILKVKIKVTGTPATGNKISVAALQVTNNSKNIITSDYATIYSRDMKELRIAGKWWYEVKGEDRHIRPAEAGVSADDYSTVDPEVDVRVINKRAWHADKMALDDDIEFELPFDGQVDLLSLIHAHAADGDVAAMCPVQDLEQLGLTWKFDILGKDQAYDATTKEPKDVNKHYIKGTNNTPQDAFVKIEGSVISADLYGTTLEGDALYHAAIGRTPIIRAYIMDGDKIVEAGYIKCKITQKVAETPSIVLDPFTLGDFNWDCAGSNELKLNVYNYNVNIYNKVHMSRAQFHETYPVCDVTTGAGAGKGTVVEKKETDAYGDVTHTLSWTMTADEMWAHKTGDVVEYDIYYGQPSALDPAVVDQTKPYVKFSIKATVKGVDEIKDYNVEEAGYIKNYWDAALTFAKANPQTPWTTTDVNDAAKDHCVFTNDLNGFFVQNAAGILDVEGVASIEYFFSTEMLDGKTLTIGSKKVTFKVEDGGKKLYAAYGEGVTVPVDADHLIASINNAGGLHVGENIVNAHNVLYYGESDKWETVNPVTASDIAKELLNEGAQAMYTYLMAKAKICGGTRTVSIKFNKKDYFQLNFLRPININAKSAKPFIDGKDMGEVGTFIKMEDLIDPYDWRKRFFNDGHDNYWDYYGIKKVTVDKAAITTDLPGGKVPTTVDVQFLEGAMTKWGATTKYGFLTYKNNGGYLDKSFIMTVPVTVEYKWGKITDVKVEVTVEPTSSAVRRR